MPLDVSSCFRITSSRLNTAVRENFGGDNTRRERLNLGSSASIPLPRLLDCILNWRANGNPKNAVMQKAFNALIAAGLEDPLNITKSVRDLAGALPAPTLLERARLIFQAVIPSASTFIFEGVEYKGLDPAHHGLNLRSPVNYLNKMREEFIAFTPDQLLQAKPEERSAICLEYTVLLVSLLREAGIKAEGYADLHHAFAVAFIDGRKYKLDATFPRFSLTDVKTIPDRQLIAAYYVDKALVYEHQGKLPEMLEAIEQALLIDPECRWAKVSKAPFLYLQGKKAEAKDLYQEATNGEDPYQMWFTFAKAAFGMKNYDESVDLLLKALKANPKHLGSMILKGRVYLAMDNFVEAGKSFDRAIKEYPASGEAWFYRGSYFAKCGNQAEAKNSYQKASELGYKPAAS